MDDPTTSVLQQADDATLALIRLLEALPPAVRTAFLMHDVFDAGYAELAGTLGIGEAACRELVARARQHLRDGGRPLV